MKTGCIGGPHVRGSDPECEYCEPLKSVWYWKPWQLSEWWKVFITTGADEYERRTLMFHLGPCGALIVAIGKPGSAPAEEERVA